MNKRKIYQDILDVYLKKIDSFPHHLQKHFFIRMYRIIGDEKYLNKINNFLKKDITEILDNLQKINQIQASDINPLENVRDTIRRNPVENKRILRRENYYQKNYQIKYYFESLSILDFLVETKAHQGKYSTHIKNILNLYQNFNWKEKLISVENFNIHPVLFINSVYRLKNLGLGDFNQDLMQIIRQNFPPKKILDHELLYDQIYTYTHLIINETKFYQQYLSPLQKKSFQWIFSFFNDQFENIYQQINLDLIIEILLCFQLAKQKIKEKHENLAHRYLLDHYDSSSGYLKADLQADEQDMEHANILFLMYLNFPQNFYQIHEPII